MYRQQRIAVVVPAYNEETQITKVIDTMPAFIDRVIIVNDKSRDRTAEVVRAHPRFASGMVVLVDHEVNQGVGGAIASGYKHARDYDFDVAVVMAGDGQMDPADLPAILLCDEPAIMKQPGELPPARVEYLPKPIELHRLLETVSRMLKQR